MHERGIGDGGIGGKSGEGGGRNRGDDTTHTSSSYKSWGLTRAKREF